MPDGWEVKYSLNPLANNSGEDPDADGLVNLAEYEHGTNPTNPNTDGDGFSDGLEVSTGSDPTDPNTIPSSGGTPSEAGISPLVIGIAVGAIIIMAAVLFILKRRK